jgi:CheY-like chemotaxis protein
MHGRILIVEDEEATAAFVQTVLERDGFTVEWVGDGAAALLALESFRLYARELVARVRAVLRLACQGADRRQL